MSFGSTRMKAVNMGHLECCVGDLAYILAESVGWAPELVDGALKADGHWVLDTQTMTLTLANAAHHAYPLLVRDGEVTELKSRGLPLGMRAGVEYREETSGLQSGDVLVLMADGCDTNSCKYLCCLWPASPVHRTPPGVLPPVPDQGMRREPSHGLKPLVQCSLIDTMAA